MATVDSHQDASEHFPNLDQNHSMKLIRILKQIWIPMGVMFSSVNCVPVSGLERSPELSCLP